MDGKNLHSIRTDYIAKTQLFYFADTLDVLSV